MDWMMLAIVLLLVFATGFLFAPLGLGGGMLFVPILHYVAGWPLDAGTLLASLCLTTVVAWGSGRVHQKEGLVDGVAVRIARRGAIPGAVIGAFLVSLLGESLDPVFKSIALVIIAFALAKTVRKMRGTSAAFAENGPLKPAPLTVGAGIGGVTSAVLAIGAGAVYIPVLHQYGGVRARVAIGSSLGIMMFVLPIAVLTHGILLEGALPDWRWLATMPFAVFIGARSGAQFGMRFSDATVLRIFFALLAIVLVRYAIDLTGRIM